MSSALAPTQSRRRASTRSSSRVRGFSLVENTLALGILAFALISLMGLIPLGLDNFQSAKSQSVEIEIMKVVSAIAQQTPYDQMTAAMSGKTLYFGENGLEVDADDPERIYAAVMQITPNVVLPAKSGTGSFTLPGLSTINVRVVQAPLGLTAQEAIDDGRILFSNSFLVADRAQ